MALAGVEHWFPIFALRFLVAALRMLGPTFARVRWRRVPSAVRVITTSDPGIDATPTVVASKPGIAAATAVTAVAATAAAGFVDQLVGFVSGKYLAQRFDDMVVGVPNARDRGSKPITSQVRALRCCEPCASQQR